MPISQARRIELYRLARLQLIEQLGGKCEDCGEDDPDKLQFDHLEPRTWQTRKVARWVRIARYRREAAEGKIELRCGSCNKKKGRPPGEPPAYQVSEEPLPE